MAVKNAKQDRGFTLVELLVVVAIIAVLIGLLMPAIAHVRIQALRVQDLAQIRQLDAACLNYAADNRGLWPLGSRLGNDTITPTDNDDVQWLNTWTFAYFLSYTSSQAAADQWLAAPTAPYPNLPDSNRQPLSCVTIAGTPDNGMYACVGINMFRFDPYSQGCYQSFLGYNYWGRRPPRISGDLFDNQGSVVGPASQFQFPQKQGVQSSFDVLLSCDAFSNSMYGEELPHCGSNDAFIVNATNALTPGDGRSGPTALMNGLCCAYTDGSAAWVARTDLWSVSAGSNNWYYFDGVHQR